MKFKTIFMVFNGVLVASFLLIFFMPLFLLGVDYFSIFWSRNWIIALVFILTLAVVNAYFSLNWGLFTRLEKEDWPALVLYLEERVLRKGIALGMYVRMLLNAYLITSNTDGILTLEAFLRKKKPRLIGRYSIPFGIPYLLMKDAAASESFFASLLATRSLASREWIRWNHAFCLLQLARPDDAKAELMSLLHSGMDPLLRLLSLYLLDVFSRQDPDAGRAVAEGRRAMQHAHTAQDIRRLVEKAGDNMQVVVLNKIVRDAEQWLYSTESPAPPEALPPRGGETVH